MSAIFGALSLALGFLSEYWIIVALIFCAVFVWLVFKAIYDLTEKNDAFENSRPVIIPKPKTAVFPAFRLDDTHTTTTTTTATITTVIVPQIKRRDPFRFKDTMHVDQSTQVPDSSKPNQVWFALVDFHNRPIEPTENSVARDVSARITYYDRKCNWRIEEDGIDGRWWKKPEIGMSDKPRDELERTNIFPGEQSVTLALACMGIRESAIYAYNNDNHKNKDFKKPEFSLGLGNYYIKVVLAGTHLKPTDFWFSVWCDKNSNELKVKSIQKPDCMR